MGGVGSGVRKNKWHYSRRLEFLRQHLRANGFLDSTNPWMRTYYKTHMNVRTIQLARDMDELVDEGFADKEFFVTETYPGRRAIRITKVNW